MKYSHSIFSKLFSLTYWKFDISDVISITKNNPTTSNFAIMSMMSEWEFIMKPISPVPLLKKYYLYLI